MTYSYFDPEEIARTIALLKPNGELYEVRIIGVDGRIRSGYFRGASKLIQELGRQDLRGANVYFTLQRVHEGCEARLQWEQFIEAGGRAKIPTTSDNDVTEYCYIPIDIDPTRPAGISSTDEELEEADNVRAMVEEHMKAHGLRSYISAWSGNGCHLLYRVPNMAKDEAKAYIEELLNSLNDLYGTDAAHIDGTNYNPARIFKLYGTRSQKGRNTASRPHRMACIREVVAWDE